MKKKSMLVCTMLLTAAVLAGCGAKSEEQGAAEPAGEAAVQEADGEQAADAATKESGSDAAAAEEGSSDDAAKEDAGQASGGKAEGDTFTVGFDAEFPPYGYMDENGEYVGFDLSLAQEVCDRNGWTLVKQPIDWDSKDMELSSGAIDCIWNGFTMNGKEDAYTWTEPYADNSQVFVVSEDAGIGDQAGLAGKMVAVQKDSSALAALNSEENQALKDSFGQLIEFGDYNTAFLELQAGSVDAIAMDIGVCKYQMESREGSYKILNEYLASEQYGVGFLKGNEALRDQVQKTLNEMADDGTFTKIAEEWELTDSVTMGK